MASSVASTSRSAGTPPSALNGVGHEGGAGAKAQPEEEAGEAGKRRRVSVRAGQAMGVVADTAARPSDLGGVRVMSNAQGASSRGPQMLAPS
jgi:hypothetical protein